MVTKEDFYYYDLRKGIKSQSIDLLFPRWKEKDERVAVLCPHDDDGILGAGYAILAAHANGGKVCLFIFCDGRAGYSTPEERGDIVERRKAETLAAYKILGIEGSDIIRFEYPDFSLWPYMGWLLPEGEGTLSKTLPLLRKLCITRLMIPNGYREHIDHEATFRIGSYDGPQVGDNILADWGKGVRIQTFLQYPVWGDLSPEDSLATGRDISLRGNRAIKAHLKVEEVVEEGLKEFRSQGKVIEDLLRARKGREGDGDVLEVYLDFDPRPVLDYSPYHIAIDNIDKRV